MCVYECMCIEGGGWGKESVSGGDLHSLMMAVEEAGLENGQVRKWMGQWWRCKLSEARFLSAPPAFHALSTVITHTKEKGVLNSLDTNV